ncbi:MAG: hypothetical protein V5A68_00270 [Candidatus Thermoplasmatota archaeon]
MNIAKKILLGSAVMVTISLVITGFLFGNLKPDMKSLHGQAKTIENTYISLEEVDVNPEVSNTNAVEIAKESLYLPENYSVNLVKAEFENPCWRILSEEGYFIDLLIDAETGDVKEVITEFNWNPAVRPTQVSGKNKVEVAQERVKRLVGISSDLESPDKVESLKNQWKVVWWQEGSGRTLSITLDLAGHITHFYNDWKKIN